MDNTVIFIDACRNGDIELLLNNSNINVHAKNDEAFKKACEYGRTEIVKILLKYNVKVNDDAFKKACERGYIEIAKLLTKYNTNYILITDDINNKIIEWSIKNII